MVASARHPIFLHRPHYAGTDDGTMVHRYLEDAFVPRFIQDAVTGRLTGAAGQAWRESDRFGRLRDLPMLRLPMHRAFYIACCEASCAIPGQPPVDPARIRSAGMVVRRGADGGSTARWLLQAGEPTGWRAGPIPDYEPDDYRRLRARGLVPAQVPEPPASGEEVHPLHPLMVQSEASGRRRGHLLLFGFLPLGGSWRADPAATGADAVGASDEPDWQAEHRWPFGTRGEPNSGWRQVHGRVMSGGLPNEALRELLATLVGRYRVQDATLAENTALRALLDQVNLYLPPPSVNATSVGDPILVPSHRTRTLLAYIDRRAEQVLEWLGAVDRGDAGRRLPAFDGAASPDSETELGRLVDGLYITEVQARLLRELMETRTRVAAESVVDGLPLPRFGQDAADVYFAKPFVRVLDARGCEQVIWGPATRPFRVAAALDPEAARPQLIALPELDDVKRGVAKGLTMLSPKSLADKIQRLKLDMDVGPQDGKTNHAGACFSFSFSLPIITLCAMILLMIMIQLLNFIFFWLPYAFLALPRLCLRLSGR